MAFFRVDLLGGCRVSRIDTGSDVEFNTRKARCLLAMIVLSPEMPMNREQLASLLWDPAPEARARGSLRQSLKELRAALGPLADQAITTDRFAVAAKPNSFDVDVLRFKDLLRSAGGDREAALLAAELWKGELFGSLLPEAPVFEAWVQIERSHLRSQLTKVLTDHLETLILAREFADARIAEELVRIEPSHELAHQYLMRFHAFRGDQSAALRQYAMLERALEDELDSEPGEDSINLLVAIKRGDIGLDRIEPAAQVRRDRSGPPRITFRPPLTRHGDSSKDYLGEGFAYLAHSALARFRSWVVIPWPASGFDASTSIDYTALGRAIDADFTIDCVLDWRGPTGKLFVSLIDCRDASEVWSGIYAIAELELQELSANVAGAVAANLSSQVNYITLRRYARNTPASPIAHDLWLRAHQLSRLWTAEADSEAEALLHSALAIDPGLACGHASLAQILNTRSIVRPGYPRRQADFATAFRHAQKAIALDPYDSRCHISMGWSWLIARSAERASSHFRLAVDLNPFETETLIAAASGLAFLGQLTDALAWAELSLRLNPIHPEYYFAYLAGIHFLNGDYRTTIETVGRCPDVFADLAIWSAAAWAHLGRANEAARAYAEFREVTMPVWEGETPPDDDALDDWLRETIPIVWAEGRQSFEDGIRLARTMAQANVVPVREPARAMPLARDRL